MEGVIFYAFQILKVKFKIREIHLLNFEFTGFKKGLKNCTFSYFC